LTSNLWPSFWISPREYSDVKLPFGLETIKKREKSLIPSGIPKLANTSQSSSPFSTPKSDTSYFMIVDKTFVLPKSDFAIKP
jgi:hypothetical protein